MDFNQKEKKGACNFLKCRFPMLSSIFNSAGQNNKTRFLWVERKEMREKKSELI